MAPLLLVGLVNFALTKMIPGWYGENYALTADALPGLHATVNTPIKTLVGIWAVEGALLVGIVFVVVTAFGRVRDAFAGVRLNVGEGAPVERLQAALLDAYQRAAPHLGTSPTG